MFIEYLLVIGLFQSLTLAAVYLFGWRKVSGSKRWLMLLISTICLSLFQGLVTFPDSSLNYLNIGVLWPYYGWCLAPFLYLWIYSLAVGQQHQNWYLHLIVPTCILFLEIIIIGFEIPLEKWAEFSLYYALYTQIFVYCWASYRCLVRYENSLQNWFSNYRLDSLLQMKIGVCLFGGLWLIDAITTTLNLIRIGPGVGVYNWYLVLESLVMTAIVVSHMKPQRPLIVADSEQSKYQNSALTIELMETLAANLDQLMLEQRLYTDEDLTLASLSQRLSITTHQLSQLLNQHYQVNFYQFINKMRIKEACNLLQASKYQQVSIFDIAIEVGFNNKNTFNRAFKLELGCTPSQFRANAQQSMVSPA